MLNFFHKNIPDGLAKQNDIRLGLNKHLQKSLTSKDKIWTYENNPTSQIGSSPYPWNIFHMSILENSSLQLSNIFSNSKQANKISLPPIEPVGNRSTCHFGIAKKQKTKPSIALEGMLIGAVIF